MQDLSNVIFNWQEIVNNSFGYAKIHIIKKKSIMDNSDIYYLKILSDNTCTEYLNVSLINNSGEALISFLMGLMYQYE